MNLADGVILAALSTEGKILFPINKAEKKVPHAAKGGNRPESSDCRGKRRG